MNKKTDPKLVRRHQHTVWLNDYEEEKFKKNLEKANGLKDSDFMREMITEGYVKAPVQKADKVEARELLKTLLEYKTHFNRISSLIRDKSPQLLDQVAQTVKGIERVINRI